VVKKLISRLERLESAQGSSSLPVCLVRINDTDNLMRINEFDFVGTIEEGELLMQRHSRLYVRFHIPWPAERN
jgi:hypothetical protein